MELRRYPYPYQAALAINSDIDGTRTGERFLGIQTFLNSRTPGPAGIGLGLEIGNSFFPYTDDDSFALFSKRSEDRAVIEALIKTGYIDTIHSYGDGADTREHAKKALDALNSRDCFLDVWVNHSQAPSNFGTGTAPGVGDLPGSRCYHADLTLQYGIRFAWLGAGTSIFTNNVRPSPAVIAQILDARHPLKTSKSAIRQIGKIVAGAANVPKARIHRHNGIIDVSCLRDGQRIIEFVRSNSFWGGLNRGHDSYGLAYVLRQGNLNRLIRRQAATIIYTHIGKGPLEAPYLPEETISALRALSRENDVGRLFVTTTSRLLNYLFAHRYLNWTTESGEDGNRIIIESITDPVKGIRDVQEKELSGITFYVPDKERTDIYLQGKRLTKAVSVGKDHTGRHCVMIPWPALEFPHGL